MENQVQVLTLQTTQLPCSSSSPSSHCSSSSPSSPSSHCSSSSCSSSCGKESSKVTSPLSFLSDAAFSLAALEAQLEEQLHNKKQLLTQLPSPSPSPPSPSLLSSSSPSVVNEEKREEGLEEEEGGRVGRVASPVSSPSSPVPPQSASSPSLSPTPSPPSSSPSSSSPPSTSTSTPTLKSSSSSSISTEGMIIVGDEKEMSQSYTSTTFILKDNLLVYKNSANLFIKKVKRKDKVCLYCKTKITPQWRKGPDGLKSLCNACGLKFSRLLLKEKNVLPTSTPNTIAMLLN